MKVTVTLELAWTEEGAAVTIRERRGGLAPSADSRQYPREGRRHREGYHGTSKLAIWRSTGWRRTPIEAEGSSQGERQLGSSCGVRSWLEGTVLGNAIRPKSLASQGPAALACRPLAVHQTVHQTMPQGPANTGKSRVARHARHGMALGRVDTQYCSCRYIHVYCVHSRASRRSGPGCGCPISEAAVARIRCCEHSRNTVT